MISRRGNDPGTVLAIIVLKSHARIVSTVLPILNNGCRLIFDSLFSVLRNNKLPIFGLKPSAKMGTFARPDHSEACHTVPRLAARALSLPSGDRTLEWSLLPRYTHSDSDLICTPWTSACFRECFHRFPHDISTGARHFTGPGLATSIICLPCVLDLPWPCKTQPST
jgi:hypothetical protein